MVREILAIVRKLPEDGVSILLVERNARAALDNSDYGHVMETGVIALSGESISLACDARVPATYLGSEAQGDWCTASGNPGRVSRLLIREDRQLTYGHGERKKWKPFDDTIHVSER